MSAVSILFLFPVVALAFYRNEFELGVILMCFYGIFIYIWGWNDALKAKREDNDTIRKS